MIKRELADTIQKQLQKKKAIILLGPRQTGKTTLIRELLKDKEYLFLNGDDVNTVRQLEGIGLSELQRIIGKYKWVFIDEAQRIKGIGLTMKLITDQMQDVQLIASGSSAFELKESVQESLTGRKYEHHLYPISWQEFEQHVGYLEAENQLEERLVMGMYPEIVDNRVESKENLKLLSESYLYKDVYAFSNVRKPELLEKLLRALALQLGNEVSYNELASLLEIEKATVAKYIEVLEKTFVVFRLPSFSRNHRNEIKNNRKIYFYDNGIRNMIINNLNPFSFRNDIGPLWENFLVSERVKRMTYAGKMTNFYFWRTDRQQEIDFIEETEGEISAFEFKWKPSKRAYTPKGFVETYGKKVNLIDRDNFRTFLMEDEKE